MLRPYQRENDPAMAQMNSARKRRVRPNDWAWHEARMNEGPRGSIRKRGAKSWDQLAAMCAKFVADWERLPDCERIAYAFPLKEDRRG